ncbi:Hypothetical predicted protein [Lecanosticta acicola]|uniref:Zinc-ribbon 15 domain-containing protein n=1 Tax=Lecanosticta acicola TaxID=111012 RepID=A0AAI8YW98_9PEZI|nr:Hypothetical predicted protein [Lecanosticta acicola]
MAFCLIMGAHTFQSLLKGYENITVQCQNCGNFSGKIKKRWEWFTVCFLPIIPFSLKPYHDVSCDICRFNQDIKYRPDVQQQMNGGGGEQGQGQIPLQNAPQGWNSGNPYAQTQQQPQYK